MPTGAWRLRMRRTHRWPLRDILTRNGPASALRRLVRDDRGFTLIEVLVTCALLTVVLGAVLNFLTTTQRIAPKDVERNHALGEAQVGLHRMTRELRQGKPPVGAPLPSAPTNSIDVVVGSVRVRYACDVASSLSGFRR